RPAPAPAGAGGPSRPAPRRRRPARGPPARPGGRRPRRPAAGGADAWPRLAAPPPRPPSHADLVLQGGQLLLPDAGDLVELGDRPKAAVRLPVGDDPLRGRRTDAVELVELLRSGGVEIERLSGRRARRRRSPTAGAAR